MIRVTDEMKAAFRAAQEQRAGELIADGASLGAHDILDRGLAAVLAVVERDRCLKPRDHVFHPLARPKPKDPRTPHAHVCISCSPDGGRPGPGCHNCRNTGMDQTPCTEPGHRAHCPQGCCDTGAVNTETNSSGGESL